MNNVMALVCNVALCVPLVGVQMAGYKAVHTFTGDCDL